MNTTYPGLPAVPFLPDDRECMCGHMDLQHHWTGTKYTYCTVHNPGKCPCERWTP